MFKINQDWLLKNKYKALTIVASVGLLMLAFRKKSLNPFESTYRRVAQEIQQKVLKARYVIQTELKLSNEDKTLILNSSIPQIHKFYESKKFTCLDVLLTFLEVALEKGFQMGYLNDVNLEDAIQKARQLDQELKSKDYKIENMPLFGIPISVKDTFIVKGTYQAFGCGAYAQKRSEIDGIQGYLINKSGGIIFAKTNLPQFGFSYESWNYLFGRSIHPQDPSRTSGGSTGGEGGLLAVNGSPLGLGSDSGGSIRIPSHFCGLYGYKPSAKRLIMRGQAKGVPTWDGIRNIASCYGPMAKHFPNLVNMMQALTTNYEQAPINIKDINFVMKTFDEKECYNNNKKYKIGVLRKINLLLPCKANQRALDIAVEKLRAQGHTVIEFDIDQSMYENVFQHVYDVMLGDGGMRGTYELYKGEPWISHFDNFKKATQSCPLWKKIYQKWLKLQDRKRELMIWKAGDHGLSYYENLQITTKLTASQIQMIQIWHDLQLDAVISPVTAGVAVKHNTAQHCFSGICYTFFWNMIDFSCGSVPITTVQEDEQFYNEESLFGAKDIEYKVLEETMKHSAGLPVGIQVISKPLEDEVCLNIMRQCGQ
ncbi:unnamed protein product [Paramecium octaurelia]|uniref:Amidase domain-containing protein n=1 Tax=Paramecium octaurelia TaxID=43137 RepID=A0A8S1U3W9_PAROT|nr:unnamed protein product [Paramecium octaurelia]